MKNGAKYCWASTTSSRVESNLRTTNPTPDPLRAPVRKQIAGHATRVRKGERVLEVLMDWPRYDMAQAAENREVDAVLRRVATGELSIEINSSSREQSPSGATGSRSTMAQTLPVDELLVNKVRATTRDIMRAIGFECVRQERDFEGWQRE